MQIIDELETVQRGPYGGGIGHVAFTGGMDMALALRTMIIPNPPAGGAASAGGNGADGRSSWTVHLQVRGLCDFVHHMYDRQQLPGPIRPRRAAADTSSRLFSTLAGGP
jgi:chorismate binding enzyme